MAFVFTWFFKERTKKGKRLDWNAEADYYWSLICSGRCFEVLVTLSFLSLFLLRRPVEAVRSYVYSRTPLYNSCCCYYSSHIWLLVTHMHIPLYYIHIVVCKNWQGLKKGLKNPEVKCCCCCCCCYSLWVQLEIESPLLCFYFIKKSSHERIRQPKMHEFVKMSF